MLSPMLMLFVVCIFIVIVFCICVWLFIKPVVGERFGDLSASQEQDVVVGEKCNDLIIAEEDVFEVVIDEELNIVL